MSSLIRTPIVEPDAPLPCFGHLYKSSSGSCRPYPLQPGILDPEHGKAANQRYFVVKNQSFSEGNRHSVAFLFGYFRGRPSSLYCPGGPRHLKDNFLKALTLPIGGSKPAGEVPRAALVISGSNSANQPPTFARMEYQLTKLAAIDIGSNAVRCQISAVLFYNGRYRLKRVEYVRYPLRLGEDVFATGEIPERKADKFVKFLHSLKLLMEVHEVSHHLICATSAMRTARNGATVAERVRQELGLDIQVIEGQAEAEYINRVIEHLLEDNRHYLHIDVGGGSTEFNIYHDRRKVAAQSFEIGSIRRMQQEESGRTVEQMDDLWQRMETWVRENARRYHVTRAIGTGGNISKLYSMSSAGSGKPITRRSIQSILDRLSGLSMAERVNVAMLNPDRADVIVPAGHIYLSAMEWAGIGSMIVPDIGLKDGMLQALFEQYFDEISPSVHPNVMPVADVENGPLG